MAVPETHSFEDLFECLKLFEVEESSPTVGGERPARGFESPTVGSIGIDRCSWRECTDHNILVLVCNNGYIVSRVKLAREKAPIFKQLKWYEGRQEHILDVVLDPLGEWLACACLSGDLYLVPILPLMTNCSPRHKFGVLDDITVIHPIKKKASPTCVVWWESMDERQFCITGSEVGEITFFDIAAKEDMATLYVNGYVDTLMIAHQTDSFTHLLIGLRGGEWKRILLEEHFHEAAGTSYSDAQASGFEVLPDDVVIKTFLDYSDYRENIPINSLPLFSELNRLSTQDWGKEHYLTSLNLQTNQLNEYTYDFEVMQNPLRTYQLVAGATGAMLTEKMIFIISHDDEQNQCAFTLSVMSRQRGSVSVIQRDENSSQSKAILQTFTLPSPSNLVGYFATTRQSHDLTYDLGESEAPPTSDLGGCVIVTTTSVYQCRQIGSPEAIFLDLALSLKSQELAESFGVTFKLDVCGLYKVAAERKLKEKQYSQALKLFQLSGNPSSYIIERFSEIERVPELVQYLHQLVYDDTPGHTSVSYPAQVQNILLKCFVHECLRCHGQPEGAVLMDKFTYVLEGLQFITDKFLYNQSKAMHLLIQCGLKEQLFELAKTHRKLDKVLELLTQHGSLEIDPSIQSSLANRQFAEVLSNTANGLFLYQMTPLTFVRLLNAKPSIIPYHLHQLHCLLPQLDLATLLRLGRLFDPSHNTIRPLLIKAHSNKKRSNSTGSLVSLISGGAGEGRGTGAGGGGGGGGDGHMTQGDQQQSAADHTPQLETYVETFLTVLIILNHRRRQKPVGQSQLLSLSPLRTAVTGSASVKSPTSVVSEGSQWVRNRTVSCGLHHSALVVNGNLFTWGSTKNGKLGHGDIEEEGQAAPLRVETLTMLGIHVVSVSCGAEHTIALCQEGIFSWGSSSHGQLGHGDTVKKTRPVQIAALADKSVVSVACGQYHSLALDDDHRVWSWGWGVHGQLGLKSVDDKSLPAHVMLLDKWQVSFIAAGYGHSAVLSSEGQVLTFGNGMYGQLGHGSTDKQSSPKVVEALSDRTVYLLACGNFHTVVVTMDQAIYYWGKNLFRQQPSSSPNGPKEYKRSREKQKTPTGSNSVLPQQVSDAFPGDTIIQLSCGSFHSLLLTSAGEVFSWGSNGSGQLGHPQISELTQPKKVHCDFNGQKIAMIAAGDEFSLVIDERGIPWTWGRTDRGQLGIAQSSPSPHSRHAHVVVKPKPIKSIEAIVLESKRSTTTSPDPNELPVLELDLGWELPDFASIGSPHTPYDRQALDSALDHLYGFYRSSAMLWKCHDWEDWESMAKILDLERQWSQALKWTLRALVDHDEPSEARGKAVSVTENYLEKFIDEAKDYLSATFVQKGFELLQNLMTSWEAYKLDFPDLEKLLSSRLAALCYPLSLVLRGDCFVHFTFDFHFSVAKEVTNLISSGHAPPEDLLDSTHSRLTAPESHTPTQDISASPKKLVLETSVGDRRLWYEILRNLSKDLSKSSSILLPESALSNIETYHSKLFQREASDDVGGNGESKMAASSFGGSEKLNGTGKFVAFTCGHAFPLSRFHSKVILEFSNRISDLPVSIPHTLRYLQLHYKQSSYYPSGCPYCVFQYLRKIQLQMKPDVPIKPWNP